MYEVFARYVSSSEFSTPENPYATVVEYQGTIYGFWVRPINYCHHVSSLMKNAIDSVFGGHSTGEEPIANDPNDVINRVFREWSREVVAYHEQANLRFSPDIFQKYQFEMQVIILPPDGELRVVTYDMNGMVSNWPGKNIALKTDGDMIAVSLSRSHQYLGTCEPRNAGILCFRDKEPTGMKYTQNRYIYNWPQLLLSIADRADQMDDPVGDLFDGSFLLIVDMDKVNAYRNYKENTQPYITVETYDGKFAFYAVPGIHYFKDMECLEGTLHLEGESLEITEVTDEAIRFVVQGKYLDTGKDQEVLLQKGGELVFERTEHNEVAMTDGEFEFAYASKLKLSWIN